MCTAALHLLATQTYTVTRSGGRLKSVSGSFHCSRLLASKLGFHHLLTFGRPFLSGIEAWTAAAGPSAAAAVGDHNQNARVVAEHCVQPMDPTKAVAVVGAGIAGAAAASHLAALGLRVCVFDLGRGPGGRMSQRREKVRLTTQAEGETLQPRAASDEELEVRFDHGAQYFSSSSPEVAAFLEQFVKDGIVADWNGRFGTWHAESRTFEPASVKPRLVGVPGMNSVCQKALSSPRITCVFNTQVGEVEWDGDRKQWELKSPAGPSLGWFDGVVIAAAYRTFRVNVKLPPGLQTPEISHLVSGITDVPADPTFALMLAFPEPLHGIPFDGAKVEGSSTIAWIARDSSKPGRAAAGRQGSVEGWVIHSTAAFAKAIMQAAPAGRPSPELLDRVGKEMLAAFASLFGPPLHLPDPVFIRVHRWGGAFPSDARAPEDKFLAGGELPIVGCGDFCISPRVDSAVESALTAASHIASKLQNPSPKI